MLKQALDESETLEMLDGMIHYWRGKKEAADATRQACVVRQMMNAASGDDLVSVLGDDGYRLSLDAYTAMCYVDAYQTVWLNLFGEVLK